MSATIGDTRPRPHPNDHGLHPASALFSADHKAHPYALYDEMRTKEPVAWNTALNAWIVSREADIASVLRDGDTFSSNRVDMARGRFDQRYAPLFDVLSLLMLQRDGADHTRLRNLMHSAFKRTAVARYEGRIRALADDLLTAAPEAGGFAYKAGLAVPLPVLVISDILGIPSDDRKRVKAWCDDFAVVALNFYANISTEALDRGLKSVEAFRQYLGERVASLSPEDPSLLASLAQAEAEGGRITPDELLANALLLLSAGNETTTVLLTSGMQRLLTTPGALPRLRADPSLIPGAVEEMLRFDAPVHFLGRIATRDATIGATTVAAGDLVLVFLASAGRDSARTPHADEFRVARKGAHHLSFGHGPHVCAGLQLARLEARVVLEAMLATFAEIRLADAPLVIGANPNLRCVEELPLMVRRH